MKKNNGEVDLNESDNHISYFRFPTKDPQRDLWIKAVKKEAEWAEDQEKINNARICSEHFISGLFASCLRL